MKIILKTLCGSRAHGLDRPDSDYDFRFVFLSPTSDMLSLDFKEKGVHWQEGETQDNTGHELFHFLKLAVHSNPSVLETLVSPKAEWTPEGQELVGLFPHIWNSVDAKNAFTGYSTNQRKKFLDNSDEARPWKFATAQIRVLLLGIELLTKGTMTVNIEEQQKLFPKEYLTFRGPFGNIKDTLLGMKEGYFRDKGFVIDWANFLENEMDKAYAANPNKKTDFDKVNAFLLKARKENW